MSSGKRKKILFILPNLNGGGAERVAITYLRQLDIAKYDVTLAVFDKTHELFGFVPKGVKLVDLHTIKTIKSFLSLIKLIRRMKPEVVYTSHSRVATLLMLVKPFTLKFWHLARMQSTPSLEKKYGEYGAITSWLYAAGFKSADIVAAETDEMRLDAIETFGIPAPRITVMHNPVDRSYIDECANSNGSPFPDEQVVAVASGRISKEKGFDILLRALPEIIKHRPDFHLYILGGGGVDLPEIVALIDNLDIGNFVKLVGFQDNPYRYYANCDLFILSSRREGFPNALIENYYFNTPIVATRCVPIIQQMINEGENGYLCDVNDSECLAEKTLSCILLKRENIRNQYTGSQLEELFDE
jgi:glycosyltransferase involved in cell wall biosynthesis